MKARLLSNFQLYLFALLLLTIDTIFMGIFEQQMVYSLLCFYAVFLLKTDRSSTLVYMLLLLACQSVVVDGYFGLSLFYLLPLSIITLEAKNLFNTTAWLPYAFISTSILSHELFIKQYLLHIPAIPLFILSTICVNLIVAAVFEKYLSQR